MIDTHINSNNNINVQYVFYVKNMSIYFLIGIGLVDRISMFKYSNRVSSE